MGLNSSIEWTDHTFNPWWGCTKVSPACDHCYAEKHANRFFPGIWGVGAKRRLFENSHWDQLITLDKAAAKAGNRPRVFCASMADVFDNHPDVIGARERLWMYIARTPNLDWLLLTKRIGNLDRMYPLAWHEEPPKNVWLGISVANQVEADRDIPKLLAAPAHIRFLSCEPLLGEIDLLPFQKGNCTVCAGSGEVLASGPTTTFPEDDDGLQRCDECGGKGTWEDNPGLDWVIVGGESGANARFMDYDWAFRIAQNCQEMGVAFFMKQGSAKNWPQFKRFEAFPPTLQFREYPHAKS